MLTILPHLCVMAMFCCVGVRFGASRPINVQNCSTYEAKPKPNTSEMVFPKAAAAIVDKHIQAPIEPSM